MAPSSEPKAHTFPCPGCGADLAFDPQGGSFKCPYCGRTEAIPQTAEQVVEKSYEEYLRVRPDRLQAMAADALEVKCEGCGSTITFTPPHVSAQCAFCGRNRVSQAQSPDPIVAPQGVLPFALTKETARASVKKWLGSLWFAPNALKSMARQEGVVGVYLPFWTYDSHTTSHYTGQRGTHYYTTETYRDGNETRTRQVRHTRWQSASGTVALFHDDVLVPATRAVSESRLRSLAPWDFERLAAYDPAYLAGYEAQRYQLDMAGGFERAKELMAGTIDSSIRHDIGGDEQQVDSVSTSYSGVSFKHLLLPVYLGAYSFKQKIYQIMVNARSGQVQGDRPYSLWKIAGAVLLALVVFFVVYQVAK